MRADGRKEHRYKLVIEAEGDSLSDIELAVQEAARRFEGGNITGTDENDEGRFHFKLEDSEA